MGHRLSRDGTPGSRLHDFRWGEVKDMILGGSISSALTTFAGLGLAMILERDGATRVRLGWTETDEPQMFIETNG